MLVGLAGRKGPGEGEASSGASKGLARCKRVEVEEEKKKRKQTTELPGRWEFGSVLAKFPRVKPGSIVRGPGGPLRARPPRPLKICLFK